MKGQEQVKWNLPFLSAKKWSSPQNRDCWNTKHVPFLSIKMAADLGYQHCIYTVNVLKFRTLVACQQSLDKQCRPWSDCFWGSSLIWVFLVCYSDKHFVNSHPDNHSLMENQHNTNVFFYKLVSDFVPSSVKNGWLYLMSLGSHPDNHHFIWEQKVKSVDIFRTFTVTLWNYIFRCRLPELQVRYRLHQL